MYGFNFRITKAIRFSVHAVGLSLAAAEKALYALPIPKSIKNEIAERAENAIATVVLGVVIIIARVGLR